MTSIALSSLGSGSGGGLLSGGSLSPASATLAGLQGGSSILGMMSSLQVGQQQQTAMDQQAADATLNAGQAQVSGQNTITGLKQQLLSTIGSRTAAAGASGVDVGQGVVKQGNATITQNAGTTSAVDLADANIRSQRQQITALADTEQGQEDEEAAQTKAMGGLLGGLFQLGKAIL